MECIILTILVGLLFYVLFNTMKKKVEKKDNPFFTPYKESTSSLENIHKQSFTRELVPSNVDAVVIGSGLSGMAAAVVLAKQGKRVLVLEQAEQAGGFSSSFIEEGYEFCSGIHYVTYCAKLSLLDTAWQFLTDGRLEWLNLGEEFDCLYLGDGKKGKKYGIRTGDKFLNDLISWFPEEEKNIRFFLSEAKKVSDQQKDIVKLRLAPSWMKPILKKIGSGKIFLKYQKETIGEVVKRLFKNDHLRALMSYMWMLVGHFKTTPASMVMCSIHCYVNKGAFYPKGGCMNIAKYMCDVIEKHGGKVLVNAEVSEILMEKGENVLGKPKVCGVKMRNGDLKIEAPVVVSCAGVFNTFKHLMGKSPLNPIPRNVLSKFEKIGENYKASPAMFYVYLGFDKSPEELDLPTHNVLAFGSFKSLWEEHWLNQTVSEVLDESSKITAPLFAGMVHHVHPNPDPNKCSTIIMSVVPYRWFQRWEKLPMKHRGNEYMELKRVITDKICNSFFSLYPKCKDAVDYEDSGSPVSVNHWVGYKFGESYGRSNETNTLYDFANPKQSTVDGLFLTGQDTAFVCGVNTAMMSGIFTSQKILGEPVLDWASQKMWHDREVAGVGKKKKK